MKREFTATTYVIENEKVLLIFHPKLQKWLPPGGHIEPNETPPEAAKREVFEETGYEIEFLLQENVWVERWNAVSFPRPYLCLLEEIPAYKDKKAHQHMDMIYVARPIRKVNVNASCLDYKWFTLNELNELSSDVDIFEETVQVIKRLLDTSICKM